MILTKKSAGRLALILWAWFPALSLAATVLPTGDASPLTAVAVYYSNEVIVACSIITSIIGSALVALAWQPPYDANFPINLTSRWVRFLTGLAGGIAAFFYFMHTSENHKLVVLEPVWVLGVSFVTPITLQVAYPALVDILSKLPSIFTGQNK